MREISQHIVDAAARLDQPFTVQHLVDGAGIDRKTAHRYLHRWKALFGWVKSAGFGAYERTKRFGGAEVTPAREGAPAGRIQVPGLDKETKPLETQIEEALAQRDRERSAGRENMARVYQDKADKLQAQLDQ